MAKQLAQIHKESVVQSLERLCGFLPEAYVGSCQSLLEYIGPFILKEFTKNASPDMLCYQLRVCQIDPDRQMCHLFPLPGSLNSVESAHLPSILIEEEWLIQSEFEGTSWICNIPGVSQLCSIIDKVYGQLTPALDLDGDRFSSIQTMRGAYWRGRDCSDIRADIHPGRRPIDQDAEADSNCNGIFGTNPKTGVSYEEEFCEGTGQRGVIYIGDSVGAHFHVPPPWFTPSLLTGSILTNLTLVLSNEFDWPHLGFATGYQNSTMPDLVEGGVDSIYLKLRRRNLCNHRDYQNLARNGAESNSTLEFMESISRHQFQDQPAIVFYSLVGNDVCNEYTDTFEHMTPAKVFRDNTIQGLRYLESQLPPNSHVVLVGLADGTVIYDAMANRFHPLGQYNEDLTYKDVYTWFNCMEIGPCHGWMSTNYTLRMMTTEHARGLNKVLRKVVKTEKFTKFDVHYFDNPFHTVVREWVAKGGQLWQLIEPVDSFHPTQATQPLIANALWKLLEKRLPHVLGPINPNNEEILKLFNGQGGH
eukprot:snap_masked-scaffold106_size358372-processed-gene-1.9 protein:Tk03537 transcript:snap_masked-scaffold106_size358372-processed-gene-1.9-mRNA-1 annotation:"acyloxyacyl hydrolase-like"